MTWFRCKQCIQFELGQRDYECALARSKYSRPPAIRSEIRYLEELHSGKIVWADCPFSMRGATTE
jgi:hypothetical protein